MLTRRSGYSPGALHDPTPSPGSDSSAPNYSPKRRVRYHWARVTAADLTDSRPYQSASSIKAITKALDELRAARAISCMGRPAQCAR
jgi:hypothetical protein